MSEELKPLKYCPRLKHSDDMPLKSPRKNCAFKGSTWIKRDTVSDRRDARECEFYPAHIRYCKANGIDLRTDFGIRFMCVLESD